MNSRTPEESFLDNAKSYLLFQHLSFGGYGVSQGREHLYIWVVELNEEKNSFWESSLLWMSDGFRESEEEVRLSVKPDRSAFQLNRSLPPNNFFVAVVICVDKGDEGNNIHWERLL